MKLLIKIMMIGIVIFILSRLLPGVTTDSYWTAIIVAIVLGFLNIFVKPFLILLTLPFTIVTLGLFLFILNAMIILLADWVVDGFYVQNIWWAMLFSICISITHSFIEKSFNANSKENQ